MGIKIYAHRQRSPGRLFPGHKENLTGILDVISFDENTIVLDTDMGLLTIKGKDLHVNRLSLEKGEIDIEGRTDSLVYSANEITSRIPVRFP